MRYSTNKEVVSAAIL